jgi:hypothetical protein
MSTESCILRNDQPDDASLQTSQIARGKSVVLETWSVEDIPRSVQVIQEISSRPQDGQKFEKNHVEVTGGRQLRRSAVYNRGG